VARLISICVTIYIALRLTVRLRTDLTIRSGEAADRSGAHSGGVDLPHLSSTRRLGELRSTQAPGRRPPRALMAPGDMAKALGVDKVSGRRGLNFLLVGHSAELDVMANVPFCARRDKQSFALEVENGYPSSIFPPHRPTCWVHQIDCLRRRTNMPH